MKNSNNTKLALNMFADVALFGLLLTASVASHAQDPGQIPGAPGGFGGGGGGGFGQGRSGGFGPGGPGGFGGRMTTGKITADDAAAGTITITTQNGEAQTIKVTADTTIDTQQTIAVKDLKVGDEVQVQGVPTGISAQSITVGAPPSFIAGGRVRRGGQGPLGAGAGGIQPVDANGNPLPPVTPPPFTAAHGKVVSTSPLMINVSENVDIVLKLGHDATITRFSSVKLGSLKVGDSIIASGATAQDGTFLATGVGVNIALGGPGGFGPGGFGPGGPGPRGLGPGGFGGGGFGGGGRRGPGAIGGAGGGGN